MANLKAFHSTDKFEWSIIGDIQSGRKVLGENMPVMVYRLMEYSMRDTLQEALGKEKSIELFRCAGRTAGVHFTKNLLNTTLNFQDFIMQLQEVMKKLKMGILRIESIGENGQLILTVSEDLDCSGLPMLGETVCNYDEGFLEGVFGEYTKKEFTAIEVDCWAKGDRVCRFSVTERM